MSRRAVILSAVPVAAALGRYVQPGDFIVACDAGYRNAARLGLQPDLIVGDFDSAPRPKTAQETIVLPHVKDDTDTQYAARWLLEHGYDEITLLGALGGARLEHTLANLATGLYLAKNGVKVLLANERSELHFLVPNTPMELHRSETGCAVREAVDSGTISKTRYASYLAMYEEASARKEWEK